MNLPQANLITISLFKLEYEMKAQTLIKKDKVPHEKSIINFISILPKSCGPFL